MSIAEKVSLFTEWGALDFLAHLRSLVLQFPLYAPRVLAVFHSCFRFSLWATSHCALLHEALAFLSAVFSAIHPNPSSPCPESVTALVPSLRVLAARLAHLSVGNPACYPLDLQMQALRWIRKVHDPRIACYLPIADVMPSPFDAPAVLAEKYRIVCSQNTAHGRVPAAQTVCGHFRILHSLMRDFEFFDETHPQALLFFSLLTYSYTSLPNDECQPASKFLLQLLGLSTKWLMSAIRATCTILRTSEPTIRVYLERLLVSFFETLASDQLQHYLPLLFALIAGHTASFPPVLAVQSLSKMIKHPSFSVDSAVNRTLLLGVLSVLIRHRPISPIFTPLSSLLETCTYLAPQYLDFVDQTAMLLRMLSRVRQQNVCQLLDLSSSSSSSSAAHPTSSQKTALEQIPSIVRPISSAAASTPVFLEFERDPSRPPIFSSDCAISIPFLLHYPERASASGVLYALVLRFTEQPGFYTHVSPIRLPLLRPSESRHCTLVISPQFPMASELRIVASYTDSAGLSMVSSLSPVQIFFHDLLVPQPFSTENTKPQDPEAGTEEWFQKTYFVTGVREEHRASLELGLAPDSDPGCPRYLFGLPPHVQMECQHSLAEGTVKLSTQFWPISGYLDGWCGRYFALQIRDKKKHFELG